MAAVRMMSPIMAAAMMIMMIPAYAGDTNPVFSPCTDTKVQKHDGFAFGLAFSSRNNFFFNDTQLSPCDSRLSLSTNGAELAVFRPKVDEISLLTINSSTFNPVTYDQIFDIFFYENIKDCGIGFLNLACRNPA